MNAKVAKIVSAGTKIGISDDPALRQNLDWDDFRVFAAVAKEGSFRKAAKVLGVKQPTIGRRIANLEKSLGIKLIDRSSRGMILTYEGRRMVETAEAMEIVVSKAVSRAFVSEREVEGECKLAMSDGVATAWFIPYYLAAFNARYPRVILRLSAAADADKIAVPPHDIQVRYAPVHDEELMMFRAATYHFTYFASTSYVENFGLPLKRDDLSNHRLADVTASFGGEAGLMAQYSNASVLGQPFLYTNSGNIVLHAVAAGQVIGLLPSYTYLLFPNLVPVIPDFHFDTGVFVYFTEAASKKGPTRGMIEFLRDVVFDKSLPWFCDSYEEPMDEWRQIFTQQRQRAFISSALAAENVGSASQYQLASQKV